MKKDLGFRIAGFPGFFGFFSGFLGLKTPGNLNYQLLMNLPVVRERKTFKFKCLLIA